MYGVQVKTDVPKKIPYAALFKRNKNYQSLPLMQYFFLMSFAKLVLSIFSRALQMSFQPNG